MDHPVLRCYSSLRTWRWCNFVIFQDDDKNKDGDDVTYANLDKSAMNGNQNNGSTVSIEDESRTEYAEIQPSKKWSRSREKPFKHSRHPKSKAQE